MQHFNKDNVYNSTNHLKLRNMKTLIEKQKSHAFGKDIYLLGCDEEGVKYWLEAPKWNCDWYWGFGYVETYLNNNNPEKARDINSHQHIDGSFMGKQGKEYIHNIYDAPLLFNPTFNESEGWELSELFNQFYFLRMAAENFGRGKCHTANTTIDLWIDKQKADEINNIIIPKVTARIIEILAPI